MHGEFIKTDFLFTNCHKKAVNRNEINRTEPNIIVPNRIDLQFLTDIPQYFFNLRIRISHTNPFKLSQERTPNPNRFFFKDSDPWSIIPA